MKVKVLLEKDCRLVYLVGPPEKPTMIVKIHLGKDHLEKKFIMQECIALNTLKNLAVPREISLPRSRVAPLAGQKKFNYVALENFPWRNSFNRSFSTAQALGLWLFTVEQICAFRRKGVLYTDLKADHLLVSEDLSGARIIDFGDGIKVRRRQIYPILNMVNSPMFAAPEFFFSQFQTERLFTYQAGMLLAGLLHRGLTNPKFQPSVKKRIKGKLLKLKLSKVYEILEKCVSKNPQSRPRNIEALLTKIQKVRLPREVYEIWTQLRAPYQRELRKLKFKEPPARALD